MTILRSREIIPKKFPPPPPPPKTLKPSTLQPSTPKKLHESSMSSSTPSPPHPNKPLEVLGLGFDDSESVSVSTPTSSGTPGSRRRSLRLASKSKMGIENDDALKKDVTTSSNVDKEKDSSSGSDTGKGKSGSKRKSRVLGSGKKKGKVYESVNEGGLGVATEVMGSEEDGEKKGEIEEKHGGDLGKLGSDTGSGSIRRRSERLVNALHEKEKEELEIDLNILPLDAVVEEGTDEKGFSSLRTRSAKRKIEVIEVDSDSHQSVHSEREGKQDDKESEEIFTLAPLQFDLNLTFDHKGKGVDVEMLETDPRPVADESISVHGGRKYSEEEKGKGALMEDNWLSIGHTPPAELNLFPEEEYLVRMAEIRKEVREKEEEYLVRMAEIRKEEKEKEHLLKLKEAKEKVMMKRSRRRVERQRFHDTAKENAARFARFQPDAEVNNRLPPVPRNEVPAPPPAAAPEIDQEIKDWPGPFSTALKIINDRNQKMKHNAPVISGTFGVGMSAPMIDWTPSEALGKSCDRLRAPLLLDLCLHILAKNSDAIVSLNVVPDSLRHKLSHLLCDSRRMDCHFMELLASGSPTEIRVKNCSWVTEEQIIKIFGGCDTNNLMVLQLDLCGRCMPDYILSSTLAQSPNSLPALASISLKGACRLTDVGLKALVTSAPGLSSINLSQCSLISSSGINHLADSLGSFLRELYLDDGQNIDMALILPALKKLEYLEVLSVAGIGTVCDDLVCEFVTECGQNMKELNFADCGNLTDTTLKAIAENCSGLCALDLSNVRKLTDSALGYLANGCRSIQILKLCRNAFSDNAVAAFLEASGDTLTELSLNNVKKVGHNTALSLARRCSRNLRSLDLSWCRNLSDPAVGLIVDNCSSLRMLKLFGCTQITKVFVDGHSNPLVRIVGLNLTPILEHLDVLSLEEGPLRYSSLPHCT